MLNLVDGWTGGIGYNLVADGRAYDLTGQTVELKLYTAAGAAVTLTGSVAITDATRGSIQFNPGSGDLVAASSPYTLRFKATDGLGKIRFFPNSNVEVWNVQPIKSGS